MRPAPRSDVPQRLAADSRPVVFFVTTVGALCGLVVGVALTWLGPVEFRNQVFEDLGQKYIQTATQFGQEKAP